MQPWGSEWKLDLTTTLRVIFFLMNLQWLSYFILQNPLMFRYFMFPTQAPATPPSTFSSSFSSYKPHTYTSFPLFFGFTSSLPLHMSKSPPPPRSRYNLFHNNNLCCIKLCTKHLNMYHHTWAIASWAIFLTILAHTYLPYIPSPRAFAHWSNSTESTSRNGRLQ